MSSQHFADRLLTACAEKNSRLVVGLDPHVNLLPRHLIQTASRDKTKSEREQLAIAALLFNKEIIAAVADHAVAVKPQLALYEQWGAAGWQTYEQTVQIAKEHGLLIIADGKRNDIGSSAEGYAAGLLGSAVEGAREVSTEADAVTVNPYLGSDGIGPFVERWRRGKGVFALVRTSNASAGDIQELSVDGRPLYMEVARLVDSWGSDLIGESGYSALGAVVGAMHSDTLRVLRRSMPNTLFLLPGFGAQGAGALDVVAAFDDQGMGAVVNSSRGIIFAYRRSDDERNFAAWAHRAAIAAKESINRALLEN